MTATAVREDRTVSGGARVSAALWRRAWLRATLTLSPPLAWFLVIYLASLLVMLVTAFWSVNPWWTPEFKELPKHEVTRGVKPFAINDEWYYHMRFVPEMKGVTSILAAVPPKSTIQITVSSAAVPKMSSENISAKFPRPTNSGAETPSQFVSDR